MDSLYIVVIFAKSKEIKVVPWKWVEGLNAARVFNGGGARKFIQRKVFFCVNFNTEANFALNIQEQFDDSIEACYECRVLKAFGKYFSLIFNHMFWKFIF